MAERKLIGGNMTIVELINDYFIEIDTYNHTLKKRYIGKDKKTEEEKECEKTIGYYRDIQECVEALVRVIPLDENNDATISLREYAESAEKAFKKVEEWRKEFDIHRSI